MLREVTCFTRKIAKPGVPDKKTRQPCNFESFGCYIGWLLLMQTACIPKERGGEGNFGRETNHLFHTHTHTHTHTRARTHARESEKMRCKRSRRYWSSWFCCSHRTSPSTTPLPLSYWKFPLPLLPHAKERARCRAFAQKWSCNIPRSTPTESRRKEEE